MMAATSSITATAAEQPQLRAETMAAATATTADTNSEVFLKRYEKLVTTMEAVDKSAYIPDETLNAWKSERADIKELYKEIYEDTFTDSELTRYSELTARYNKRMAAVKLNDVGDAINNASDNVTESVKRTSKKVKGWFKGLKK